MINNDDYRRLNTAEAWNAYKENFNYKFKNSNSFSMLKCRKIILLYALLDIYCKKLITNKLK